MEPSPSLFLVLIGSLFILTAGIGLLRLPDAICRAHALSKAVTLGLSLILLPLIFTLSSALASLKIILIILFHFVTLPVAGHIFALYACQYEKTDLGEHNQPDPLNKIPRSP